MKKEEIRHDPIRDRIVRLVDYLEKNKNMTFTVLGSLVVAVFLWTNYKSNDQSFKNQAKAVSGKAQNAYNSGQFEIAKKDFNELLNLHQGSKAANQALIYLLADSYINEEDSAFNSLYDKYVDDVDDDIYANVYEAKGNMLQNNGDYENAAKYFSLAMQISSDSENYASYAISMIQNYILLKDYSSAQKIISKFTDKDISFSYKNKIDELDSYIRSVGLN